MLSKNLLPIAVLFFFAFLSTSSFAQGKRDFYELRIYHIENANQESQIDAYLEKALLPALHRNGVAKVGVFKPIASEADAGKKVYLFIPYSSMKVYAGMEEKLGKDQAYQAAGAAYINAPFDNPPYKRIETAFMQAFTGQPRFTE